MRRTIVLVSLISVLAGMLLITSSAFGIKAGHNLPTDRLEAAYKIALFERRFSKDGCYPRPRALAKAIHKGTHRKVGVALNTRQLANLNEVYVLRQGASCGHVRMALRASAGSTSSTPSRARSGSRDARAGPLLGRSPAQHAALATKTFHAHQARHGAAARDPLPGRQVSDRRRNDHRPAHRARWRRRLSPLI